MKSPWLPVALVADLQAKPVSDRAIRLRIERGMYGEEGTGWRRGTIGCNANGLEIALTACSADEQLAYFDRDTDPGQQALVRSHGLKVVEDAVARRTLAFANANDNQRARATRRKAAVLDLEIALADKQRAKSESITAIKEAVAKQHGCSIDALQRWYDAHTDHGMDGLVDGNDGSARRGKSVIPKTVRSFFRETWKSAPSTAAAIDDARLFATDAGIDLSKVADDAFYRYAETFGELLRRANRTEEDEPTWLPSTRRDYTGLPAMKIVQSDHHISDVFVSCGDPECKKGHRVWLTVFIDVRSRMVLAWTGALEYPNSQTILKTFRALVEEFGLPEGVYIDNGKDYRKAFGKATRSWGAPAINEGHFNNLLAALGMKAIFATPYRAQSKTIERLFGTFVRRIWSLSPAYVGKLGKRSERATKLFNNPEGLPTLEEFREQLKTEITLYNTDKRHRGQGMNGQSPQEVFHATRPAERRMPDPAGFALVFWQHYVRMIRGCAVTIGADRYRIEAEAIGFEYEGKYVQVLVNPDDVRRASVLTGCVHCKPEVRRELLTACGCAGKGNALCEAVLWAPSTFSFDDPVTDENNKTIKRLARFYKERARHGDPMAERMRDDFARRRHEIQRAVATVREREQQPLIAAGNGATVILGGHSQVARDMTRVRALLANPLQLTDTERSGIALVERPSIARLEAMVPERSSSFGALIDISAIDEALAELNHANKGFGGKSASDAPKGENL
jgi:transposase InsO family protein